MNGYLQIVLHSHLPFVLSHGRWPHGADWIFEAACETYIPLLQALRKAEIAKIPLKFTIGISPVLAEQLSHMAFPESLVGYIRMKIEAAQEDERYFAEIGDNYRQHLSQMWQDFYTKILHDYRDSNGDIIGEFRKYQEKGMIEVITCAATHGYLPLLGTDNSVFAQLSIAKQYHKKHFGAEPKGIWIPEAAYRPRYEWIPPAGKDKKPRMRKGIEEFLYHLDIRYFYVDSHLLKGGKAIGVYIDRFEALQKLWTQFDKMYKPREELPRSPYKPYLCSSHDGKYATPIYARDPKTCLQVWSGDWGYPGNSGYLDFHKKHFPGGHRYWRVTDTDADLADKKLYQPELIEGILYEQASHFRELCDSVIAEKATDLDYPPAITAPFDTELFGHWWHEGPRWLYALAKEIKNSGSFEMTRGWDYLEKNPPKEIVHLPEGSWGQGGFHYIWLNDWTNWTWEHIYKAEEDMRGLSNRWIREGGNPKLKRVLSQLGRELLLLESSDWQFLISTWSARDYAEQRVVFHWDKFNETKKIAELLFDEKEPSSGQWRQLELLEAQDDIFPELEPSLWADRFLDF